MPYIKQEDRTAAEACPMTAGELNYCVTTLCDVYLREKGLNYQNLNEIMGVLGCVQQEFYRRVAAPYEDIKIVNNGDVFSDENLTE